MQHGREPDNIDNNNKKYSLIYRHSKYVITKRQLTKRTTYETKWVNTKSQFSPKIMHHMISHDKQGETNNSLSRFTTYTTNATIVTGFQLLKTHFQLIPMIANRIFFLNLNLSQKWLGLHLLKKQKTININSYVSWRNQYY